MSAIEIDQASKRLKWEHERTGASIEQILQGLTVDTAIGASRLQSILSQEAIPTFQEYVALSEVYEKLPTQRKIKLTQTRRKRLNTLLKASSFEKSHIAEILDLRGELQKELSNDFIGYYPTKILKEEYDELVKYLQSGERGRIVITDKDKEELKGHLRRSGLSLRQALRSLELKNPTPQTIKNWIYKDGSQTTNRAELARIKEAFENLPDRVIEFRMNYREIMVIDPFVKGLFKRKSIIMILE